MSTTSEDSSIQDLDEEESFNPFIEENYIKLLERGAFGNEHEIEWVANEYNPLGVSNTFAWKQKVLNAFLKINGDLSAEQRQLAESIGSHKDLFMVNEPLDTERHDRIVSVLAAHILNHLLSARDRILKNNFKLSSDSNLEFRDQGFTRPRVLVILPFKNAAYRLVMRMIELWGADRGEGVQVEQRRRFTEEYGRVLDDDGDEVEEDLSDKPKDFQHLFAGNIDDCFRIGIKVTRKALKLYSDFYSSDILVASPLGLKLVLDGQDQQHQKKIKGDKQKARRIASADSDFLSSIEIAIFDQADVVTMQNWEHVAEVFGKISQVPKDSHGCDFSRVMSVFLDSRMRQCRQNIVLSSFSFPELHRLFKEQSLNVMGAIRMSTSDHPPIMPVFQLKPEFHIFPVPSPDAQCEAEERFQYFVRQVRPQLESTAHAVLHCSNYFEFVRLREHLHTTAIPFEAISEYSDPRAVTRARSRFYNGHARILLLTERFHFFHRFVIKGVRRLVFYSLPCYPSLFVDWMDMVSVGRKVKKAPVILCSLLDRSKVERIFGSRALQKIFI